MAKYTSEGHFRTVFGVKLGIHDIESQPIESGGTANGIADLYYSSMKHEIRGWVELKNEDGLPKRGTHKVKYRPGQYPWLKRYVKQGTSCTLGIAFEEGVVFFTDTDIEKEYTLDRLLARIVRVDSDIVPAFIQSVKEGVNSAKTHASSALKLFEPVSLERSGTGGAPPEASSTSC
jgi:hypothetical protein